MSIRKETLLLMKAYEDYFQQYPEERRKYELREKAIRDYNSDMRKTGTKAVKKENIKRRRLLCSICCAWVWIWSKLLSCADVTQQEAAKLRRTIGRGTT